MHLLETGTYDLILFSSGSRKDNLISPACHATKNRDTSYAEDEQSIIQAQSNLAD